MNPLLLSGVFKVIDKLIPDNEKKSQAQIEILKLTQESESKQLDAAVQLSNNQTEINKIDAASESFYKSGWRSSCGWICAFGLFYNYIFQPIAPAIFLILTNKIVTFPQIDVESIMALLLPLLGLASLRTYEKVKKS